MRTKPFALFSDLVLVALVVVGAVFLFAVGFYQGGATTDRPMLPLSVDGSRILLLVAFARLALNPAVLGYHPRIAIPSLQRSFRAPATR